MAWADAVSKDLPKSIKQRGTAPWGARLQALTRETFLRTFFSKELRQRLF
jgi:hypothetical protein